MITLPFILPLSIMFMCFFSYITGINAMSLAFNNCHMLFLISDEGDNPSYHYIINRTKEVM